MPRDGRVRKREILGDAVYNHPWIQRFIHKLMTRWKKTKAEHVIYGTLNALQAKTKKDPVKIFEEVIESVMPLMEVRPRRVGGATYQVPTEVPKDRGLSLAMQWLRDYARKRKGHSMVEKLTQEMLDASNRLGGAYKKREDTHKMAEANKAFAHFRW
mgnify:CR=1 FL=1